MVFKQEFMHTGSGRSRAYGRPLKIDLELLGEIEVNWRANTKESFFWFPGINFDNCSVNFLFTFNSISCAIWNIRKHNSWIW